MGDQHLSELCRGIELEPIQLRLKQVAGDEVATLAGDEEGDAATTYVSGMWGYRDEDGRTAFHWAVALKNYDLARKLLAAPCNSPVLTEDNDCVTPFETACTVGAPEDFVVELLEKSAAAYAAFKLCPSLHSAKRKEAAAAAKPLVPQETTAPTPAANGTFETAPTVEATAGVAPAAPPAQPESANEETEDPTLAVLNHEDELGNTPLIHAVSRGHRRLAKLLLEKGADLNHQNERGQTALHRAVSRGNQDLVEELVRSSERANGSANVAHRRWVNLQDYRGDSALFYASMENNEEIGRFLLSHGADRDLRSKEGKQFWEV